MLLLCLAAHPVLLEQGLPVTGARHIPLDDLREAVFAIKLVAFEDFVGLFIEADALAHTFALCIDRGGLASPLSEFHLTHHFR